jgi:hypothetical protein
LVPDRCLRDLVRKALRRALQLQGLVRPRCDIRTAAVESRLLFFERARAAEDVREPVIAFVTRVLEQRSLEAAQWHLS